jgi:hypothetical protein
MFSAPAARVTEFASTEIGREISTQITLGIGLPTLDLGM